MKKILRRSFRKRIAILLLAVMLIPLVPVIPIFADSTVPDFPYLSQSWYDTNTDSFALWEVHGSDNVSYVQTRTNVFSSGAFPVVYRSGLSWTGYYYYIDYSKIIDTWDKDGNHIDGGYSWSQNIRVPVPNETTVNSEVYATLVYCTTDIYHGNGAGDNDIYAYQNFIVPSYADPTPTPIPEPALPSPSGDYYFGFTYHQNGSDYDCHSFIFNDACASRQAYGDRAVAALTDGNLVYSFYSVWEHLTSDRYNRMAITEGSGIVFNSSTYSIGAATVFYDLDTSSYVSFSPFLQYNTAGSFNSFAFSPNTVCKFGYKFGSLPDVSELNTFVSSSGSTYVSDFHFGTKAVYSYFGDGGSTPIATPTPTAVPTAIPQPSISPVPTEPPDSGEDNNWTGLFGWLRRIRDSILNIPKKIASGILDALKYIFLPDPEKVKGVFNTLNDKFGIQHPTKFTVDPNELFRPANVVWAFRPISLNGEEREPVDVTIINFEEVDEWLESSPGMVITRILQAMFGITMFAYLIYIFTKHIATINYNDAHTLMHLDDPPQTQRGGRR